MKKHRILAAAALLALPSMLISVPGYSTTDLPPIDPAASGLGQQSCPAESQGGCFGSSFLGGGNPMMNIMMGKAESFRREGVSTCMRFLQLRPGFDADKG